MNRMFLRMLLLCAVSVLIQQLLLCRGVQALGEPPGPNQQGGHWCRCPQLSLNCQWQYLRFRPAHDRAPVKSYIQNGVDFYAVRGRTMPRITIQVAKGGYSLSANETDPDRSSWDPNGLSSEVVNLDIEPTVTLTVKAVTIEIVNSTTGSIGESFTTSDPIVAVAGQFHIDSLLITGQSGAIGYLNFSTNTGIWLTSPKLIVYEVPTGVGADEPLLKLQFKQGDFLFNGRSEGPHDVTTLVVGRALPSFTVEVVDPGGVGVADENAKTIVAVGNYEIKSLWGAPVANVTLNNNRATIKGYLATFEALELDKTTLTSSPFRLTFYLEGRPSLSVTTALLRARATPVSAATMELAGPESSFLNRVTKIRPTVVLDKELPVIRIQLMDSAFSPDYGLTGMIIKASSAEVSIRDHGSFAAVRSGVATFDSLQLTGVPRGAFPPGSQQTGSEVWPIMITFTAGKYGTAPVQGHQLVSPLMDITPRSQLQLSSVVGLRYRPYDSFLLYEGQSVWTNRDTLIPPIAVELLTERQERGTSSGDVVSILATPSSVLRGTKVTRTQYGVATFDDLRFMTTEERQTVTLQVYFGRLSLVACTVTVVNNTVPSIALRFEPFPTSLIPAEGMPGFATQQTELPPIVLEVLNSEGNVDTGANELVVEATSSIFLINSVAVSHHGRIVFPNLMFGAEGDVVVRFLVIKAPVASYLQASATPLLSTGDFAVVASTIPRFELKFHPEGIIKYPNQRWRVAVAANNNGSMGAIGFQVVASDHSLESGASLANLQVRVQSSEGSSLGANEGRTAAFDPATGVAWFTGLSVVKRAYTRIIFTCEYKNLSAVDEVIEVVGKSIASGELYFVGADEPVEIRLHSWKQKNQTESGAFPVNDVISAREYKAGGETTLALNLTIHRGGGGVVAPPTVEESAVVATSSDPLGNSSSSFASPANGIFSNLAFHSTSYIQGFFSVLTFTSQWDALSRWGPFRVGTFYYDAIETDADEPVVVAEISLIDPVFSLDLWLAAFSELMRVSLSRVEIVRVRPAATASTGYELSWKGKRVEFRFLSPTTSSTEKASSRELAEMFLAIDENDCDVNALRMKRKYYREQMPTCDVYRLEDQLHGARRCVATSPPSDRCKCHEPLFAAVGTQCKDVAEMNQICAELQRCTSDLINDLCYAYELSVYSQYLGIAGGVLGALLVLLLIFLWKVGFFAKTKRVRLSKKKEGEVSMKGKAMEAGGQDADAVLI